MRPYPEASTGATATEKEDADSPSNRRTAHRFLKTLQRNDGGGLSYEDWCLKFRKVTGAAVHPLIGRDGENTGIAG
jgi:hypothetical protein